MTLLRSGSASDTGLVRASNQDLALESQSLFAVADGMGGHVGGEVASRLAIDSLQQAFSRQPSGAGLSSAVVDANTTIWQHSMEHSELRGMGTTLTAIALVNEEGKDVLALVNVGDSRSYRFHAGALSQITVDHSLAEEMVRNGELTAAEGAVHPHRHILTRALGVSDEVDVDLWRIRPARGDRYLLCSDGLTNELGNNQIIEVLSSISDPQAAADLLVRAARTHGGGDNITVVVVDVVMGEDDSGSTPAVAAVNDDFSPVVSMADATDIVASVGGASAAAGKPLVVPAPKLPNRRERRRTKRRERRRERGRRLITFRSLLFVVLVGAVVAGALFAVRWYDANSYFVGLNNNELVIYQGRVGGFLWYHPQEVQRTGVTTADIPKQYLPFLEGGVTKGSVAASQSYVQNLLADQASTHTTTSTLPAPPTTTSTSTTLAERRR